MMTSKWLAAGLLLAGACVSAADATGNGVAKAPALKKEFITPIEAMARAKGGGKTAVRSNIFKEVQKLADVKIDRIRSPQDRLTGFVTYATPGDKDAGGERPYVAYIYLNWGDLDNLIHHGKKNYSNWDGNVKIQEGGYASVVQEFAFDEGKGEPGPDTGHDKLLQDEKSSQVTWLAGVTGATDGLLVKLAMQKPEATGNITIGPFIIPYQIRAKPEAVQPK